MQFNETQNEIVGGERKWNDYKARKASLLQGKFTFAETKLVTNALCQYAKANMFDPKDLVIMCSAPSAELSSEQKKAWCKVAEALPNRSV